MYAWQRRNVDALNGLARQRWRDEGRLDGPELVASGGRRYQAGDLIVTLAPGSETTTSERGQVVDVRPHDNTLILSMDDGRFVRLTGDETASDSLAHGYAGRPGIDHVRKGRVPVGPHLDAAVLGVPPGPTGPSW